jgi:dynamin 1-like protein
MNFKTMAAQIKDEAEFLREQYPKLSNKCGTPYLADTLNRLYLEQIRISWPTIRETINDQILLNQACLASLDIEDKEGNFLQILLKFSATYCRSRKLKSAEIQKTSEESFSRTLDRIGSLTGLSKLHIQAAIKSAAGQKSSLVTAFQKLAKKEIELLKEPSLNCVRFVVKKVQEIAGVLSLDCKATSPVFKELFKERVQLSNGLVEKLLESDIRGSRQASRRLTRKQ